MHRIPWQRVLTYNDLCRQYTNYVTIIYGHAIVVLDGYQEELSTKDMVLMNAAQVEVQAQQWISHGIWS